MLPDPRTIFNALAENYDAYRPHYPADTILFLVTLAELDRTSTIADLGTGTGRLALALAPYVRLVYALDPATQMLEKLEENARAEALTNIRTLEAAGERTGLPTDSVDLVTLAQSFHWMDQRAAITEISRVLKPHKPLVLIWNQSTDVNEEFYLDLQKLITEFNAGYHGGADIVSSDFPETLGASGLFHPTERYSFPFSVTYTAESYIGYLLSKSYIGVGIQKDRLPDFMHSVHDTLFTHFGSERFTEHYETIVLAARSVE